MPIYTQAHLLIMITFAFLIGASVGSFLNVCILRIPRKISLSIPGSHCFHCGTSLGIQENIPIIGYFILKGKCKHCGSVFSFQYAWVEITTACCSVLFLLISLQSPHSLNFLHFINLLIFFSILLTATLIDFKWEMIPDQITIPAFVYFIVIHFFNDSALLVPQDSPDLIVNRPVALIILLAIFTIYFAISHLEQSSDTISKLNTLLLTLLTISVAYAYFFADHSFLPISKHTFEALTGALFCGGILYLMILPFRILNFSEFLGEGDIKLFLVIGAFWGSIFTYTILLSWLYITAILASILIYKQALRFLHNKLEAIAGGVFLTIMTIGIFLIAYTQAFNPNRTIFVIGVMLFLSTGYSFFLLVKKWSDQKIIAQGLPMAPFIFIASMLYLLYKVNWLEKINFIKSHF